ncbi:hypothetical protein NMY22_g20047 [Coprinellus aureogranulatus]|nr:hypothetical protein NMY22_g20047 [Coprinellus aureogranulatus]
MDQLVASADFEERQTSGGQDKDKDKNPHNPTNDPWNNVFPPLPSLSSHSHPFASSFYEEILSDDDDLIDFIDADAADGAYYGDLWQYDEDDEDDSEFDYDSEYDEELEDDIMDVDREIARMQDEEEEEELRMTRAELAALDAIYGGRRARRGVLGNGNGGGNGGGNASGSGSGSGNGNGNGNGNGDGAGGTGTSGPHPPHAIAVVFTDDESSLSSEDEIVAVRRTRVLPANANRRRGIQRPGASRVIDLAGEDATEVIDLAEDSDGDANGTIHQPLQRRGRGGQGNAGRARLVWLRRSKL